MRVGVGPATQPVKHKKSTETANIDQGTQTDLFNLISTDIDSSENPPIQNIPRDNAQNLTRVSGLFGAKSITRIGTWNV